MSIPTIFADDPDPTVIGTVTDETGANVTLSPDCAVDGGPYTIVGTWLDTPAPIRRIRVPVAGHAVGAHTVNLKVPGGRDFPLGTFYVRTRT